jgi:hypothetical protein
MEKGKSGKKSMEIQYIKTRVSQSCSARLLQGTRKLPSKPRNERGRSQAGSDLSKSDAPEVWQPRSNERRRNAKNGRAGLRGVVFLQFGQMGQKFLLVG